MEVEDDPDHSRGGRSCCSDDLQPAAAVYYEAPWCAVLGMGKGVYWDCQYATFEACRPNVLAGNRGWCNPNPYFVASNVPTEGKHHHQRRTHLQ